MMGGSAKPLDLGEPDPAKAAGRGPAKGVVSAKPTSAPSDTPGPTGVSDEAAQAAKVKADTRSTETKNAEKELDLLRRLYSRVKNKSATKSYFSHKTVKKKKAWIYETDEYIKDRKDFFGSTKKYEDYKKKAKEELDEDKGKLRKYIEPQVSVRNKHSDWKDAQDIFYSWVKKAYDKKAGDKADFAKVIKAQMSEKLKKALDQVKSDYEKSFKAGGFNPRPQKMSGAYRLGTISEHAVGNAIDIEAAKNPQVESWRWKRIQSYTGKKANPSDLKAKWKSKDEKKAKEAYDAFKAVNDEWVSKLSKAGKKREEDVAKKTAAAKAAASKSDSAEATAKKAEAPKPAAKVDHLRAVIDADENLKNIGANWVTKWKDGFLTLEWNLVKELHEEGFAWGALFSSPDLHHFEL